MMRKCTQFVNTWTHNRKCLRRGAFSQSEPTIDPPAVSLWTAGVSHAVRHRLSLPRRSEVVCLWAGAIPWLWGGAGVEQGTSTKRRTQERGSTRAIHLRRAFQ